ncbi:MAG TPA: YciK family oxidoreductase [Chromatiales bacterium]|nr:YciK family oxidoreductase [Chromatiales bacterium]
MKSIPADYQPAPDLLHDRVVLVTGAGDGIGAAAARSFAAHGATVILLGKTIPKLEAVYDEIEQAGSPQAAIYPLDLEGARYEHYQQLADTVEKEFGRLDGLLHNAAILGARMMVEQYDLKLWARVLHVNLTAPFLLSRTCLPLLRKSADASVMFTSTGVAQHGSAYWGAYGVSKAGADNLMQIMADELETNTPIRVNSIDPGVVRTRMRRQAYPGEDASRLPLPETIMPAYLYLMGPDSRGETGEIFMAQG